MEVFVARQPIFTNKKEVFGYELLYRNNLENKFPNINGDEATAEVIINSFLTIGIDEISNGKPCFLNFTEKLLQLKLPTYFKPHEIVVEILETVEPNPELLKICKELKSLGYQIALDDFVLDEQNQFTFNLFPFVDIIKVDFQNTTFKMRTKIEKIAKERKIKLLAEKVETRQEFIQATLRGYHYFQGYFFAEPAIVSTKDIPTYFHSYLELINNLSEVEPRIDLIAKWIEQDLSLSYKLLKLINSPAFRPKQKIKSIQQAIVMLGLIEIKKWIYVLSVRDLSGRKQDFTNELITISLTRAKMCELLVREKGRSSNSTYFLTGMFSLMDSLLNTSMEMVLVALPLHEDICDALKGKKNHLKEMLELVIAVEKGNWEDFGEICNKFGFKENQVLTQYHQALKWSTDLMKMENSPYVHN
ncbi:HDOD domain-containing protein [Neobacillus sp. PS3-40]|uniref:EAL and HDOD domain-containing protein n=1 Tax=Neobacillus sp. PS3-40 TaxID=3070679 RepID=UPI0027DFB911|nr:HDOD domain-containing protein [Neobacillus sp. PS3-40]WML44972.1 HDOD domain-containing protein [Neobacillus sp. PS3-40]